MSKTTSPWVRGRGMHRLLAHETNISDLIQFLSDRDPSPWKELVGFAPVRVEREEGTSNNADLFISSESRSAVVEVKLGHVMSIEQQEAYESIASRPDLYLAALKFDEVRLQSDSDRWSFLSLSELVGRWRKVDDELAGLLADNAAGVLSQWDRMISGVFYPRASENRLPLSILDQKFLGRVVTRRIKNDLLARDRSAYAGLTSGGGLPVIQGRTAVRGEGLDRAFVAEVRWREGRSGGDLRFGVDFCPRRGQVEDTEVRRAAYDLARDMDADIDSASLLEYLSHERPDLAELLRQDRPSRPKAKGNWEQVIRSGFNGASQAEGRKINRRNTSPDFYGDGTLRFEAKAEIEFQRASAHDVTDLIDATLAYLSSREPLPVEASELLREPSI